MLRIYTFNVELGQSIFLYPESVPTSSCLIDCGNSPSFEPVDLLIDLLPKRFGKAILPNFVLTNYDHDHFSGLPYLLKKAHIETVYLPRNLNSNELIRTKSQNTRPLEELTTIMDTYIFPVDNSHLPYKIRTFYLSQAELGTGTSNTNNLSQVVFIEYQGVTTCVPGDIEVAAWKKLLAKSDFCEWLKKTTIFFASHHGRENGYHKEVFDYCKPESILISDKWVVHSTQEGMSSVYGKHIQGSGVSLNGDTKNKRKVLTTRSDGHIFIQIDRFGKTTYATF